MTRPWRLAEWLPLLVWDRRSGDRAWRWSRGRPRSRPLEPVGRETRVKLHRSVQRRMELCPDYRPCNLPPLERCDLVDDSPSLDGYR
ncbi:Uncharacterised protein [Pseudomonas aeruginosa]|nr:Uncharacterised protein [Pseudomonas aeruginosa]